MDGDIKLAEAIGLWHEALAVRRRGPSHVAMVEARMFYQKSRDLQEMLI